jgi:hypothetical protein
MLHFPRIVLELARASHHLYAAPAPLIRCARSADSLRPLR